jgi:hypothetical protein
MRGSTVIGFGRYDNLDNDNDNDNDNDAEGIP